MLKLVASASLTILFAALIPGSLDLLEADGRAMFAATFGWQLPFVLVLANVCACAMALSLFISSIFDYADRRVADSVPAQKNHPVVEKNRRKAKVHA